MRFSDVQGQEKALTLIRKALSHERLPHAWLFSGPRGVGKFSTAIALAKTLNCRQHGLDACGTCDFCRQISEEVFPDFRVVRPDGKNIRIAQVRDSLNWLNLRPDRARRRVLIFDGAEHLNRESANAFLKTLEEPPPQTLIILVALSPRHLLETIVSRCQHIRFRPLEPEVVEQLLKENQEWTLEQARVLASLCAGSVRSDLANQLELVQTVRDSTLRWLCSFTPAAMEEALLHCTVWAKSKNDEWKILLDVLESWFRDLAWLNHGLPESQLLNRDRLPQLRQCARKFTLQSVYDFGGDLAELREAIELNANKALVLESLWIRFKHQTAT